MPLTKAARENHDAPFPGHVSTLAVTDPELIEMFDNFAFDEILKHSALPIRLRLITQLAAITARQAANEYRYMLGAALENGVTPVEAKGILYQAVPYVGIARAFDFLHATNDVLKAWGVELPFKGHVAANLNVGNDRALMTDVVTQLLPFIGYARTLNALRAIDDIVGQTGA